MPKKVELDRSEREGFGLLLQAAFANPFGDERAALDLQIAGAAGPVPRDERLRLLLERVTTWLLKLDASGRSDVRAFAGKDREIVETAVLFDAYYAVAAPFDALIQSQLERGDDPCPVPFAEEAVARLRRRGLAPADSLQWFALLYQLRRAYFFIGRELIGKSQSMKRLRRQLWDAVVTHDIRTYALLLLNRMEEFSTLILGETGTGKGTAAAAIGRSGFIPFDEKKGRFVESFTRAFVSINLSQFPEALIESELFGHRKGAFTGAVEDHEGILARCSPHGAVLLDEIGEVSTPVQIKLLQVLQDRRFCPVGSHKQRLFRGRILAATHRSLEDLRRQGLMRDDFFYRVCSARIAVPPLRERLKEEPAELDELLAHVLRRLTGATPEELLARLRTAIEAELPREYAWPGNVRELEQCVRSLLLTGRYAGDLESAMDGPRSRLLAGAEAGSLDARGLLQAYCAHLHERHGSLSEVARRTRLDRRTVRKHVEAGRRPPRAPRN